MMLRPHQVTYLRHHYNLPLAIQTATGGEQSLGVNGHWGRAITSGEQSLGVNGHSGRRTLVA